MKQTLGMSLILTGALLAGGCATKKYVQQNSAPIQSKVDQVAATRPWTSRSEYRMSVCSRSGRLANRVRRMLSSSEERCPANSRAMDRAGTPTQQV